MMICPVSRVIGERYGKCQRSQCAWWVKETRACAIRVIAETGGYCCQSHSDYEAIQDDETDMKDREAGLN